jgi:hypothetical protein
MTPRRQTYHCARTFGLDVKGKRMVRDAPVKDTTRLVEMIPSGEGAVPIGFPAGIIAQAWLDEFSEELTWAELVRWLSEV